jgi:hypothetical protein
MAIAPRERLLYVLAYVFELMDGLNWPVGFHASARELSISPISLLLI